MRYLAAAYDRRDAAALHAVTRPIACAQLMAMRGGAVHLSLQRSESAPDGRYPCYFRHDYPASLHRRGHGSSTMYVVPARLSGWRMAELLDCG